MCGIIAVLRRRSARGAPDLGALEAVVLAEAVARFLAIPTSADPVGDAIEVAGILESVDRALSGVPGLSALLGDRLALAALEHRADDVARTLAQVDAEVEAVLTARHGRRRRVAERRAGALEGRALGDPAGSSALGAGRRRPVGRRHVTRRRRDLRLDPDRAERARPPRGSRPRLGRALGARRRPRSRPCRPHGREDHRASAATGLFASGAVRASESAARSRSSTRSRRRSASWATTPRRCGPRSAPTTCSGSRCAHPHAHATVLGHTRWASVGIISEPNAHPLDNEELEGERSNRSCVAALNGDIDNHADLRALESAAHLEPRSRPTRR